jgi:hypothetical protein
VQQTYPPSCHPICSTTQNQTTKQQLGAATWAAALVTVELALPHRAARRAYATPLWQVGTALAGALVAALLYGRTRRPSAAAVLKGI